MALFRHLNFPCSCYFDRSKCTGGKFNICKGNFRCYTEVLILSDFIFASLTIEPRLRNTLLYYDRKNDCCNNYTCLPNL